MSALFLKNKVGYKLSPVSQCLRYKRHYTDRRTDKGAQRNGCAAHYEDR